jgi:hypothetical protein
MNRMLKVIVMITLIFITFSNALIAEQKPKRIAILELEAKNAPKPYAEIIRDLLEVKLQKSRIFDVLERNQIKMILNEQKFQLSDCSDSICAVQIGKILYADMVIVGSLSKIAKYTLALKIVDVKNGSIMLADSETAETDAELDRAASSIVDRIVRDIQSNNYGAKVDAFNDSKKQFGKPMDFGVYYRYGLISNMEIPAIKIPNNYPEPFTLSKEKISTSKMEVFVAPNIGINNNFKLRPSFKFGWGLDGEGNDGYKTINNVYNSDDYSASFSSGKKFSFNNTGAGLSVLFEYPFHKLIPFIGAGIGYSYYYTSGLNYNFEVKSINPSPYSFGIDYYNMIIDNHANIIYTELEIGFSAFITEQIGLTFSGIYNYTIYGNLFRNIKITKKGSIGDTSQIPPEYQDLDKKIKTSSWDDKRLAPIMYLQVGVVYRL